MMRRKDGSEGFYSLKVGKRENVGVGEVKQMEME